jgi:hypothetical protein
VSGELCNVGGASHPANPAFAQSGVRISTLVHIIRHRRECPACPHDYHCLSSVAGAGISSWFASCSSYVVNSSRCNKRRLRYICLWQRIIVARLPFALPTFRRLPSSPTPRRSFFPFPPLPFSSASISRDARHNPVRSVRAAIDRINQRAVPECGDARRRQLRAFPSGTRRGRQCDRCDGALSRRVRARGREVRTARVSWVYLCQDAEHIAL